MLVLTPPIISKPPRQNGPPKSPYVTDEEAADIMKMLTDNK